MQCCCLRERFVTGLTRACAIRAVARKEGSGGEPGRHSPETGNVGFSHGLGRGYGFGECSSNAILIRWHAPLFCWQGALIVVDPYHRGDTIWLTVLR